MNRGHLGDSYDAVKRLWQQTLLQWAPLYAEQVFVPAELREDFTRMTLIPMMPASVTGAYSLFNDPDTGIPAPSGVRQDTSRTHASLQFISEQLNRKSVRCVVTFDQSHHRQGGVPAPDQRAAKLRWLRERDRHALYYVSHAPFLFACPSSGRLRKVRSLLLGVGIPAGRLESLVA